MFVVSGSISIGLSYWLIRRLFEEKGDELFKTGCW